MPAATSELRGREREIGTIAQCVRGTAAGAGSVLLVEGGAGTGKSSLLAVAERTARSAGFLVGIGTASRSTRFVPMAPLMDALFGGAAPVVDRDVVASAVTTSAGSSRQAHRLEPFLAAVAQRTPICIAIDDAHWSDDDTLTALRLLTERLPDVPVLWLVAYRARAAPAALAELVAHATDDGAAIVTLDPLDDAAVTHVATDILGAAPDTGALTFAARANGNPRLLTAALRGAVEDERVTMERGHARVAHGHVPARVVRMVQDTMTYVSPTARQALATAAVLDEHTTFDRLVEMLAVSPTALLGPIDELLACDLLAGTGTRLGFASDLVRDAIRAALPPTAHRALCRHAIDVLVADGVAPVGPAAELADRAEPGDRGATATLTSAARALRAHDIGAAAELSRRALDLMTLADATRADLAAGTATLLHAAGRALEAVAVVDDALRVPTEPASHARLHLSVATMLDLPASSRVEAGRAALALPDLSVELRERHAAQLAWNFLEDGRADDAVAQLATPSSDDEVAARTRAATRAGLDYARGAYRDALTVARDVGARRLHAESLLPLDDFDTAHEIATHEIDRARRAHHVSARSYWERFRARCCLQTGSLDDAVVDDPDARAFVTAGRIAIHTGDHRGTKQAAKVATAALAGPSLEARRHAAWALMLCALATDDVTDAHARLTGTPPDQLVPRLGVDVAAPPQIVRFARATRNEALTAYAIAIADECARQNPGAAAIEAAASHARGLAHDDPTLLAHAVARFATTRRRLAHASALEDWGVALVRHHDEPAGVDALSAALRAYTETGATWDASRVRHRLRRRGVRRRIVNTTRPATGWDGLTDAEHAVVRLVADGLTNREVAERLFVSPHTASMHLRHVFTKLEINSRVELTRLVLEREQAA